MPEQPLVKKAHGNQASDDADGIVWTEMIRD